MPKQQDDQHRSKNYSGLQWILFVLIMAVLVLSVLAFINPVVREVSDPEPSPTVLDPIDDSTALGSELPSTPENEVFTQRPEEIGYTDEIIFWSTVLILILLVGTMRETIYRKGR